MNQKRILGLLLGAVLLCTSMTACGAKQTKIESLSDLSGAKIACIGDTTSETYANGIQDSTVLTYTGGLEAVQALQSGQADAVIMDKVSAEIYTAHSSDVKILDNQLQTESYVIAYKKGSEKFGNLLNETLSSLKAEGKVDEILSHWVGDSADHISYVPTEQDSKGELVMATVANLPPFSETEGNAVVGIEPDVMRAVCDKMGMTLVIREMSSMDEVLNEVKSGKANVALSRISVQKDYLTRASFTESYFDSEQVIIVHS